jgi:hypothetical protein
MADRSACPCPDEDASPSEEHLIVLFHILMKVQTGEKS